MVSALHIVQGTNAESLKKSVLGLISSRTSQKTFQVSPFVFFCKKNKKEKGGGLVGLLACNRPYLPAIPTDGMGKQ